MPIRVGIAGVSGYAGVELLRILSAHPGVVLTALAAQRARPLDQIWPGWIGRGPGLSVDVMDSCRLARSCDVVFLALPHGVSATIVPELLDEGLTVVDLGADFRLRSVETAEASYGPHPCPELLKRAVYAMPELNRQQLPGARLLACPGCYPTATAIAALPLVEAGLAEVVISDCLSGISGAGRKAGPRNLFGAVADSATAYGLAGSHRHSSEMEQTLGVPVVFTPHLVPMLRGMIATVKVRLLREISATDLYALYQARYDAEVAVVLRTEPPASNDVRGTAAAHVTVALDPQRHYATAVCAIDNLGKGAAGQAVHAFNIAMGLPETQGLPLSPVLP